MYIKNGQLFGLDWLNDIKTFLEFQIHLDIEWLIKFKQNYKSRKYTVNIYPMQRYEEFRVNGENYMMGDWRMAINGDIFDYVANDRYIHL